MRPFDISWASGASPAPPCEWKVSQRLWTLKVHNTQRTNHQNHPLTLPTSCSYKTNTSPEAVLSLPSLQQSFLLRIPGENLDFHVSFSCQSTILLENPAAKSLLVLNLLKLDSTQVCVYSKHLNCFFSEHSGWRVELVQFKIKQALIKL